jgi:hypothetical protein
MQNQSCAPYRGFTIDVRIKANNVVSLNGKELRYSVSWSILSSDLPATAVTSLPQQLDFLSREEAFSYAERRAHTFIDGCLYAPDIESIASVT